MKKTKNNFKNLNEYHGTINFAFCPSTAIKASNEFMIKTQEVKTIIKDYPHLKVNDVLDSFRYFYICYSIKIDNIDQKNKDYFYFQIFSQVGKEQVSTSPIYGFYSSDEVLSMIRDIDDSIGLEKHDRQVFETYQDELSGNINDIIALMQDWTSLKLLQFEEFYFKDKLAVESLFKLIKGSEKIKESKTKVKKTTRLTPKNIKSKLKNEKKEN